jgi:hypothetical protein
MDRWDNLFRAEQELMLSRRANGIPPLVSGFDGLQVLKIAERAIAAQFTK